MKSFDQYGAETHRVENQSPDRGDLNLYTEDRALQDAVLRCDAAWAIKDLGEVGARLGRREIMELGFLANEQKPHLKTHNSRGERVDEVTYTPAYHQLMAHSMELGLHSSHWTRPGPGAHVARGARYYMMTQVEQGHLCPITMTSAAIPTLRHEPGLLDTWGLKILDRAYDPRNVPDGLKSSVTIGMAMTEKQGGSDVRSNSTRAYALGDGAYELVGHKFFVSAPMCDAFLMLAYSEGGLSCFLVPRWRPDGTRNAIQIQQLKNKMGNGSNASSETELRGAWGRLVGTEGRGVATIIDMVAMTRVDCMLGSSGIMRSALSHALHHCRHRKAFGALLVDQPLMTNVLADLVLEHEASLALTMRLLVSLDRAHSHPVEAELLRLATAIGKYWICKRTPGFTYEAMEVRGGMGVMEDLIYPRLYREAPINAIWEGSGNVQCLDVVRALDKNPSCLEAFWQEVNSAKSSGNQDFDRFVTHLESMMSDPEDWPYRSRGIVGSMAMALQGSLLLRHAPQVVSQAFCAARLGDPHAGRLFGELPRGIDVRALINRSLAAE